MCGIAGIYRSDAELADPYLVEAMTRRIAHRGPDGSGSWAEGRVALGHRRLAIRDLSVAGAQPFHSPCGRIVVVYNGELYNDRELALELNRRRGFVARTGCDTEVIPEAYLEWGDRFVERLEGIYAIALYDRLDDRLLLVRDPHGAKPLYIRELATGFQFASETKAFDADPGFRPRFSSPDLEHMLALGYVAPNRSLFENVHQLAPGTILTVTPGGRSERQFWRATRTPLERNLERASDRVIETLRQVVNDQIVSDVPIAILQSGGIDSTLLSACLPLQCDVRLFSVRFSDRSHDESSLAGMVAARLKRHLTLIDLDSSNVETDFRGLVTAVDGSLADSSGLAAYQLARAVRPYATVALSGDGADEFFGGYPTYRASAFAYRLRSFLPAGLFRIGKPVAALVARQSEARLGKGEVLLRLLDGLSSTHPHAAWRRYLMEDHRSSLTGVATGDDPISAYAAAGMDGTNAWDRAFLADQRYYLPGDMLVKTDRSSMYHGLEVRVPFLDRRMSNLAAGLDRSLLADRSGHTKIVLRRALEKLGLPPEIFAMPKMGFNLPMNRLLHGDLLPLADRLLDQNADILQPEIAADGVRRIWREHRMRQRDHRFVVWTLLVLATWKEDNFRI